MSNNNNPHISINAQYIKDLSFENPKAPFSLVSIGKNPQIDLRVDLNITKLPEEDFFEVELSIEASARKEFNSNNNETKEASFDAKEKDNLVFFVVELKYAGIFHLINVEPENQEALLSIHCPNLIFPFARKIIADTTQDGGFQPLMIDPIDFGLLYHKKMNQDQN